MVRRVHKYANGGQVKELGMDEDQQKRVAEMRRQRDAGIAQTRAKFKAQAATAAAASAAVAAAAPRLAPRLTPRPAPAPVPAPAPATVDRSGTRTGARPQVGQADAATRRKMLDAALSPGPPVRTSAPKPPPTAQPSVVPGVGGELRARKLDEIVDKKSR